jgi:thioredoxin reductase (NADPH)
LSDGSDVRARIVVLAVGVAWRRLDAPGVETLVGHGVFYGAGATEAPAMSGCQVFVVGGGNSAGQAAIYLSRFASRVTMLVRGKSLGVSLSDYLVKQIEMTSNIDVRCRTTVLAAHGDGRLENLELSQADTDEGEVVPADALFILIGAEPRTNWLTPTIATEQAGYVLTGRDVMLDEQARDLWPLERLPYLLEASVPGVFAAGDVRFRSIKRVASASGEGATTIQMAHEYLANG